jgi:murein DD-endopeptidase MepM/ murein hydrolase activator NlpD
LSVVIDTGRVTQHFGEHPEIYGPGGHTGVDIGAPAGTVVRAAGAGEAHPLVSLDGGGAYSGYGIYVLIVHSPVFTTLYAHLSAQLVSEGERVAQGDPVGLVGSTGWSTGPHLHFELRFYGRVVDPEIWLSMFLGLAQSPPAELSAFNGAPAPLSRTVN